MTGTPHPSGVAARVCVAGAGAIGLLLAARLALAGNAVTVLARGATLAAIRDGGIVLMDRHGTHRAQVTAVERPQAMHHDLVILASKAQDLQALAALAKPAVGVGTLVLPTVNGVPWWYFEGIGGPDEGRIIEAVDPGGVLKRHLPASQLVGAATYITAERIAPNVTRTSNPLRMKVGAVTPAARAGAQRVKNMLDAAQVPAELVDDIRAAVWEKLLNNLTTNPLSVVAGATLKDIFAAPLLAPVVRAIIEEVRAAAAAYGADVSLNLEEAAKLGDVRTSMLQDYEKGHPLELAAIGDAVVELARHRGVAMARTSDILALARFRMLKTQSLAARSPEGTAG